MVKERPSCFIAIQQKGISMEKPCISRVAISEQKRGPSMLVTHCMLPNTSSSTHSLDLGRDPSNFGTEIGILKGSRQIRCTFKMATSARRQGRSMHPRTSSQADILQLKQ